MQTEKCNNRNDAGIRCPYCKSYATIKSGIRRNKHTERQLFFCRKCEKKFTFRDGSCGKHYNIDIITESVSLWCNGLSLRKIQHHILVFRKVKISHITIMRWIYYFSERVSRYVMTLNYNLSETFMADESAVRFRFNNNWSTVIMDKDKKFIISIVLSQFRRAEDLEVCFKKGKVLAKKSPKKFQTDGLSCYPDLIQRFFEGTEHLKHSMASQKACMNTMERVQGDVKARTRPTRGFHSVETGQKMMDAWAINKNFCLKHSKLKTTPAKACGIDMGNEGDDIWKTLIKKSGDWENE